MNAQMNSSKATINENNHGNGMTNTPFYSSQTYMLIVLWLCGRNDGSNEERTEGRNEGRTEGRNKGRYE